MAAWGGRRRSRYARRPGPAGSRPPAAAGPASGRSAAAGRAGCSTAGRTRGTHGSSTSRCRRPPPARRRTRPPSVGAASTRVTATPRSARPVAAASPAIPPPTTTAVGCRSGRPSRDGRRWRVPDRSRVAAGYPVVAVATQRHHAGRRPWNVWMIPCCQPRADRVRTSSKPASVIRCMTVSTESMSMHAAPQVVVEPGAPRREPAERHDDATADRGPDRLRHRSPRDGVLVDDQRPAGPQQVVERSQQAVAVGHVAEQVCGEDPVQGLEPGVGAYLVQRLRPAVLEPHPARPRLLPRLHQHPGRPVDAEHLGPDAAPVQLVDQRPGRGAGSAAEVDDPRALARDQPRRPARPHCARRWAW